MLKLRWNFSAVSPVEDWLLSLGEARAIRAAIAIRHTRRRCVCLVILAPACLKVCSGLERSQQNATPPTCLYVLRRSLVPLDWGGMQKVTSGSGLMRGSLARKRRAKDAAGAASRWEIYMDLR